jgi:hypothetical protein
LFYKDKIMIMKEKVLDEASFEEALSNPSGPISNI